MHNPIAPALLVLFVFSYAQLQAEEPSLGERLEKLAPRAAGVALVEVLEIKEVDMRGGCGPLYLDVRWRIVRGSGETPNNIHIVKEHGGHPAPNTVPFKPYGPVKTDTFQKGGRYWVAFSSPFDFRQYPQSVVNFWPEKAGPKEIEEAIRADHYAHRPFYDPESGLTMSHRAAGDKQSWRVRLERDGKLLWEVDLPGEKFKEAYAEWFIMNRAQHVEFGPENREGIDLFAETMATLPEENPFGLPAGKYRLRYALDADSGTTAGIWVAPFDRSPQSTASVIHYFNLQTGRVQREVRNDFLETGGLAIGAPEEKWLRKIERKFDPDSGQLKSQVVYRWAEISRLEGGRYVPVNKE